MALPGELMSVLYLCSSTVDDRTDFTTAKVYYSSFTDLAAVTMRNWGPGEVQR